MVVSLMNLPDGVGVSSMSRDSISWVAVLSRVLMAIESMTERVTSVLSEAVPLVAEVEEEERRKEAVKTAPKTSNRVKKATKMAKLGLLIAFKLSPPEHVSPYYLAFLLLSIIAQARLKIQEKSFPGTN